MANPDDSFNPGQESVAQTASPSISTVTARNDPNGNVSQLLQALGSQSAQAGAADFQQVWKARQLQEQSMKIDAYTQQFMADNKDGGPVSQAQVKARFPETVPVIAAKIAESIGKQQTTQQFQSVIDNIDQNPALRLNTAARAQYLQAQKAQAMQNVPDGNDFFKAGVAQQMDSMIATNNQRWLGETAQYHEQVQTDQLKTDAVTALQSDDPAAAFAQLDKNRSMSTSLDNRQANAAYVDAAIKLATQSYDPSILQKLPQKYLNVDSKGALTQANLSIQAAQWAVYTRQQTLSAEQREKADRDAILEMIQKKSAGQPIDLSQYTVPNGNGKAHDFGVQLLSQPMIAPQASAAARTAFENSIYSSGYTTSVGSVGDITDQITKLAATGKLNPDDAAAMIKAAPDMVQGHILMNSPQVERSKSDYITPRLDAMEKSPNAELSKFVNGINLRGNAMSMFEGEIQNNAKAFYQDNGRWPGGLEMRQITDNAVSKTSAYIDKQTSAEALKNFSTSPTATLAKPAAAPIASPTARPGGLPKGVTLIK